jgi:hypothetical protein
VTGQRCGRPKNGDFVPGIEGNSCLIHDILTSSAASAARSPVDTGGSFNWSKKQGHPAYFGQRATTVSIG